MAVSFVAIIMAQAKCQDLLLNLFKCKFVIIPHAEELLCFLVHSRRNVNGAVIMLGKAPGYDLGIALVRLDSFLATLFQHRGRGKNLALYIAGRQLMV